MVVIGLFVYGRCDLHRCYLYAVVAIGLLLSVCLSLSLPALPFFFLFFFFSHTSTFQFWTSRGHRCRPFSPPVLAFNFYRA